MLLSTRHSLVRRLIRISLVATMALGLSACDSCSKPKETTPDMSAVKPKDMGKPKAEPDLPPEDPLKEAKADADTKGLNAAIATVDRANLVAADMEANAQKGDSSAPKIRKTQEDAFKGSLDPKDANKVFRNFDGAMKACYERALKRSPGLEGQAMLTLKISPDGGVMGAKASGISLKDNMVFKCMEALTPKMKFPAPKGGAALLRKTYTFSPQL